jgi:uncharacterized protein YjiS (DUF1127 family)
MAERNPILAILRRTANAIAGLDLLREPWRYLAGSPRSRIRQAAALRALDDRLLADIGITPWEARLRQSMKPPYPSGGCGTSSAAYSSPPLRLYSASSRGP